MPKRRVDMSWIVEMIVWMDGQRKVSEELWTYFDYTVLEEIQKKARCLS